MLYLQVRTDPEDKTVVKTERTKKQNKTRTQDLWC